MNVDIAWPKDSRTLALVVDDAGDGFSYDHGDWINPTLVMEDGMEIPVTGNMMKDKYTQSFYNVINENTNVTNNGKMSVMGIKYDRGFSTDANALMIFNIPEGVVRFKAIAALDDSGVGQNGATTSIKFYVFDQDPRLNDGNAIQETTHTVDLTQLGYAPDQKVTFYDVWNDSTIVGTFSGNMTQTVKRHSSKLFRLVPERSGNNELTLKAAPDEKGNFLITATVKGKVDDYSYVKFFMDDQFVGTVKVAPGTNSVAYHAQQPAAGKHTFRAQYSGTTDSPACEAKPIEINVSTDVAQTVTDKVHDRLNIKAGNGQVNITTAPYSTVRIYRPDGVADSVTTANAEGHAVAMLNRGLYIVQANQSSRTILVK